MHIFTGIQLVHSTTSLGHFYFIVFQYSKLPYVITLLPAHQPENKWPNRSNEVCRPQTCHSQPMLNVVVNQKACFVRIILFSSLRGTLVQLSKVPHCTQIRFQYQGQQASAFCRLLCKILMLKSQMQGHVTKASECFIHQIYFSYRRCIKVRMLLSLFRVTESFHSSQGNPKSLREGLSPSTLLQKFNRM